MTVCQTCGITFEVYRESQLIHRGDRCFSHRVNAEAVASDRLAVARLRKSFAAADRPSAGRAFMPRADLRDDERAENARRRNETSEAWRSDAPLEPESAGEDRLLLALGLAA